MKDWASKRRKVFCYGTRNGQEVFIISFASKMDEPEKRSLLGLNNGDGLYSQCFGHIYDFVKYLSELCNLFFIFERIGLNSEWSTKTISNVMILLRIGWKRKKKMN